MDQTTLTCMTGFPISSYSLCICDYLLLPTSEIVAYRRLLLNCGLLPSTSETVSDYSDWLNQQFHLQENLEVVLLIINSTTPLSYDILKKWGSSAYY